MPRIFLFLFNAAILSFASSSLTKSTLFNTKILGIGNFIFIFAERLIKKDEEITTSYIECTKEYKKKQEILQKFYGFECKCELCQIENTKFIEMPEIKTKISSYINTICFSLGSKILKVISNEQKEIDNEKLVNELEEYTL